MPEATSTPTTEFRSQVPAKHPRGLYTLFFTEMWERFSYYGMRALLILFMVDSVRGGLGLSDKMAASIYGLYTAAAYLAALPGGWMADRILGAQRSIWYGGMLISAGHFVLAIPNSRTFYLGLLLVALGTGMLKPNVSVMVGDLYPEGGARRDAGFSIFYMGINLGAFLGPFVCGTLGEKYNWHYGFAAAGVGMVLGLVQFRASRRHLAEAGTHTSNPLAFTTVQKIVGGVILIAAILFIAGSMAGIIQLNPISIASATSKVLVGIAIFYFAFIIFFCGMEKREQQRVLLIAVLCFAAALFWAGYEQAGSSLNLFAERYTQRNFGFEIRTSWFQALSPIFVISLAPVMGGIWISLGKRHLNPSTPVKFAFGLILLGLGFLVMAGAAMFVARGEKVWPTWLVLTYLLHTFGELCVSPVGLSSVTKLSPRRFVGQMMGAWFLATSFGNLLAGTLAGEFRADALNEMPGRFFQMMILPLIVAAVLFALARLARPVLPASE